MIGESPDITLAFATWLLKARKGLRYTLFNRKSNLLDIRIQHFGEGGAFHHHYDTQTEDYSYRSHEAPVSRIHSISWVREETCPHHRPADGQFEDRTHSYDLDHSKEVKTCYNCNGQGTVRCGSCSGSGNCSTCGGRGSVSEYRDGEHKSVSCSSCSGGRCSSCGGSGRVTCSTCNGEGQLVHWTSKDYVWKHHVDPETILLENVDRGNVKRLVKKTLNKGGAISMDNFTVEEVNQRTGLVNERITDTVHLAQRERDRLESEIERRPGSILFQEVRRHFIFLGYLNVNMGKKFGQFFVAGNKKYTSVSPPPVAWSALKIGTWATSLGVGLAWFADYMEWVFLEEFLPLISLVPIPVGLAALGLLIWEACRKSKPRWLVFDDQGLSGWYFTYLYGQFLARKDIAYIKDPGLVTLMEQPQREVANKRNSFMCTFVEKKVAKPRQWELLNVSHHAQETFADQVDPLLPGTARLTWIIAEAGRDRIDHKISSTLTKMPESERGHLDIWVIIDGTGQPVLNLSQTEALIGNKVRVCVLPMERMYEASRSGALSDDIAQYFDHLGELPIWPEKHEVKQ